MPFCIKYGGAAGREWPGFSTTRSDHFELLDKDPERRYQSVAQLRVDLERLRTPSTLCPNLEERSPLRAVPGGSGYRLLFWLPLRLPSMSVESVLICLAVAAQRNPIDCRFAVGEPSHNAKKTILPTE